MASSRVTDSGCWLQHRQSPPMITTMDATPCSPALTSLSSDSLGDEVVAASPLLVSDQLKSRIPFKGSGTQLDIHHEAAFFRSNHSTGSQRVPSSSLSHSPHLHGIASTRTGNAVSPKRTEDRATRRTSSSRNTANVRSRDDNKITVEPESQRLLGSGLFPAKPPLQCDKDNDVIESLSPNILDKGLFSRVTTTRACGDGGNDIKSGTHNSLDNGSFLERAATRQEGDNDSYATSLEPSSPILGHSPNRLSNHIDQFDTQLLSVMADGPQIPSQTQILHDSDQSMTSLDLELSQPLSFSSSCSHDEPEISVPNSPNLNRALLTPSSHGPQTSLITKGRIIPHLQPHHKEAEDTFRLASEYICELATHASDEPRLVIEEVCIAETQNAALELAQAHSVLDSAVRRTTRSSLSAEVSRSQTISATVKSELISPKPAKRRPRKREQKPSQNITPVSKRLRTLELRASKNLFSSITFLLTGFSGSAHTEERTRLIAFIESLGGRVGRTDTVDDCVSLSDPLDSLPRIVIMNGSRRNWSTKIFYTLLRGVPPVQPSWLDVCQADGHLVSLLPHAGQFAAVPGLSKTHYPHNRTGRPLSQFRIAYYGTDKKDFMSVIHAAGAVSLRQQGSADLIIFGDCTSQSAALRNRIAQARMASIPVLNLQWLKKVALEQRAVPFLRSKFRLDDKLSPN